MAVYFINDQSSSSENKKWKWLLSYLAVRNVELESPADLRKSKSGSINRFAQAEPQDEWILKTSEEFQKDLVSKKIPQCFLKWDEKNCL